VELLNAYSAQFSLRTSPGWLGVWLERRRRKRKINRKRKSVKTLNQTVT
jgi:hypothetical protein